MEKRLTEKPFIHKNSIINNSCFGEYTEIGEQNYIDNVELGDYSYTGPFCFLQNTIVGKFSNIAAMVRVGPTNHPIERPTLHHITYRKKMYGFDEKDDEVLFENRRSQTTYIGHDTWIGHGAIIMPGLKIGNGSVIGCGAVVTKDVPEYTVVAGVPAKVIKKRFHENTWKKLEEIKWWDWPYEKIKENLSDLSGDTEEFIKKFRTGD
jgi:phosphonate metabolism protein (transferase hexapeptide repeat family)